MKFDHLGALMMSFGNLVKKEIEKSEAIIEMVHHCFRERSNTRRAGTGRIVGSDLTIFLWWLHQDVALYALLTKQFEKVAVARAGRTTLVRCSVKLGATSTFGHLACLGAAGVDKPPSATC